MSSSVASLPSPSATGVDLIDSVSPSPCSRAGILASTPPFAISGLSVTVAENTPWTSPAPSVTGAPVGALTWSIDGDDAGEFRIAEESGVLTLEAQDFEHPVDADADGIYEVTLNATDSGGNNATALVSVTITDVEMRMRVPTATRVRTATGVTTPAGSREPA